MKPFKAILTRFKLSRTSPKVASSFLACLIPCNVGYYTLPFIHFGIPKFLFQYHFPIQNRTLVDVSIHNVNMNNNLVGQDAKNNKSPSTFL